MPQIKQIHKFKPQGKPHMHIAKKRAYDAVGLFINFKIYMGPRNKGKPDDLRKPF